MRTQLPRRPRLPAPGRRGDRPARGGAGGLGGRRPVHHRPRRCRAPARRTAAVTEGERLRPRVRHRHRARLLLTFGSLSDRFGREGMLLAGLTVVGAASLAGGFTTTSAQLIAARAVMGLGAAMTFPATLSLISNVFTERRERARAIGLWGAIGGVAIAVGPIAGGWLLEHFSWAAIFTAMAPVAAVRDPGGARRSRLQGPALGSRGHPRPGAVVGNHCPAGVHHHR